MVEHKQPIQNTEHTVNSWLAVFYSINVTVNPLLAAMAFQRAQRIPDFQLL